MIINFLSYIVKLSPVEADLLVQVQTINDLSLSGEYIDATIAASMTWYDFRLQWAPDTFANVKRIGINPVNLWTPDIDIVNRLNDFAPSDEKRHMAEVWFDGTVHMTRLFRMRASIGALIKNYPYDTQIARIVFGASNYATGQLQVCVNIVSNLVLGGFFISLFVTVVRHSFFAL